MTVTIEKGKKSSAPSWMKTGKAAKDAVAQEEVKAKAKEEQQGKAFRFWIPKDVETKITFLDGLLDEDGILDVPLFWEHQLKLNGNWKNWFVCTVDDEPCPICQAGLDKGPSLVGALTIIDHSSYTSPSNGKTYKDQIKLYVPKRGTLNMLQKQAKPHGGLAGCTFEVSRVGEKSAGVGDVYIFEQQRTLKQLAKAYPETKVEVLDYSKEIIYRNADELRELGFGGASVGAADSGVQAGGYAESL